ncbi:hypothetical protein FOZ61_001037, partial [Perkinsus olseni]
EFSDVLKDELTRESQLLNEAREHAFEGDANRDLPPIGDENADKNLPRSDEQYAKEVIAEIRLDECTNLSTAQQNDLKRVITKWCRIFHLPGEKFEEIRGYKHHIDTGDHEPLYCTPYPLPESQVRFVKSEIDRMIAEGICRPSESSWSSPILVVAKKDEHGQKVRPRLVIDYRRLNSITRFDAYPLPQIETLLSRLNKKCFYSKLDMYSGFWHVGMAPDSISRTAFTTPYGIFEYLRLPFGLVGAPATFMRTVNSVFADLLSEVTADSGYFLCAYMDDLLISSSTWAEHLQHLSRAAADEVTDLEIDAGAAVDMVEAMKTAHACVRLALLDSRLKAKDRYDQALVTKAELHQITESVTMLDPSTRINVDRLVHLSFPAAFHYDVDDSSPSLSERNIREQQRSHSENDLYQDMSSEKYFVKLEDLLKNETCWFSITRWCSQESDVIFPLTVLERAPTAPPDDMNISDKSTEKRR